MEFDEHGGGCCGIFHLYNFPSIENGKVRNFGKWDRPEEFLKDQIESAKSSFGMEEDIGSEEGYWNDDGVFIVEMPDPSGKKDRLGYPKWIEVPADPQPERAQKNDKRVIECVLTDHQLAEGWGRYLRHAGFTPVSRFLNSNSMNICTVFHLHPDGVAVNLGDIPTWNELVVEMQG